jgi:hypothetical protein
MRNNVLVSLKEKKGKLAEDTYSHLLAYAQYISERYTKMSSFLEQLRSQG